MRSAKLTVRRAKIEYLDENGNTIGGPDFVVIANDEVNQAISSAFPDTSMLNLMIDGSQSILQLADIRGSVFFWPDHRRIGLHNYEGTNWCAPPRDQMPEGTPEDPPAPEPAGASRAFWEEVDDSEEEGDEDEDSDEDEYEENDEEDEEEYDEEGSAIDQDEADLERLAASLSANQAASPHSPAWLPSINAFNQYVPPPMSALNEVELARIVQQMGLQPALVVPPETTSVESL